MLGCHHQLKYGVPLVPHTPSAPHSHIMMSQCATDVGDVMKCWVLWSKYLLRIQRNYALLPWLDIRLHFLSFGALPSVLIYGTASAAQAIETRVGWGTEEVHSYIRSILKVMRQENIEMGDQVF